MVLNTNGQAPYAPTRAVTNILSRFRDRGLQSPITIDVLMKAGIQESLAPRVQQTLRLLDFIDDEGVPNSTFDALQRAPESEYRKGLADMIRAAYAEVYRFADPATDGVDRLRDAFRGFNPRGQQERMISLFLGLCEFAEIDASAAIADRRAGTEISARNVNRAISKIKPRPSVLTRQDLLKAKIQNDIANSALPNIAQLPQGLVGLLQQIPLKGAGWSRSRRDEFMNAFGAVLDFSVPVREHEPEVVADE
jgi:hypothetical protein